MTAPPIAAGIFLLWPTVLVCVITGNCWRSWQVYAAPTYLAGNEFSEPGTRPRFVSVAGKAGGPWLFMT